MRRTERGWAGHFCCAPSCWFRRNTLLEFDNDIRIVVSTVGNYHPIDGPEMVGLDRFYETMAFGARWDGTYWDADVSKEVHFNSPWTIDSLSHASDREANEMHETVVAELIERFSDS